ncbi:MAG: 23S rRNA (uracil(1939)-C(5))-methyltransferase RlmD [Bacteroidales bacterium]
MSKTNLHGQLIEVDIIDTTVEGKGVAKLDDKVFFVNDAIPGDKLIIKIISKKRRYFEAINHKIIQPSPNRQQPFCNHFGICGGCKWQHMTYSAQKKFKEKQVFDQLERIGKLNIQTKYPIIECQNTQYYRNKLDFTFSTHPWFLNANDTQKPVLGFHIPGRFDKVIDIEKCFLQPEPSNKIRNLIRSIAIKENMPFYDIKKHEGFLRNLVLRNNSKGEFMVILVIAYEHSEWIRLIQEKIKSEIPEVISFYVAINSKMNDSLENVELKLLWGAETLKETLLDLKFEISPVSFFQTNLFQTEQLYTKILEWSNLKGNELVYDLFCGTGTISLILAKKARFVIGIEYVKEAINDAYSNAAKNNIHNVYFEAGDVKDVLFKKNIKKYGTPDLIVLDPPRSGVHPDVIDALIQILPPKIIYVSCNASTQARDLALLCQHYKIIAVQPVDMFPHTSHVENIALLEKISTINI